MGVHPCPECGRGFATKDYLSRHVLTHSGDGRPFCCQLCDKRYLTSSHLADHMRTHSAACDSLCDVCGKRFRHPKQLRVHAVLHKGVKPYACDQCGYSAAFLSCLIRHRKTHGPERPHGCADCPRRFLTRQNLQEHRRRRHRRRGATLLLALAAPAAAPAPPAATADAQLDADSRFSPLPDAEEADDDEDGFSGAIPPPVARHDAFLEDDDPAGGCHPLENVTLTSAAGGEEDESKARVGGEAALLERPESPQGGVRALADQLFAEAAAVVFDAADADSMVLDERVPMVGVEMELNDQ